MVLRKSQRPASYGILKKKGRLGRQIQFNLWHYDKTGKLIGEKYLPSNSTWADLGKAVYKASQKKNVRGVGVTLE